MRLACLFCFLAFSLSADDRLTLPAFLAKVRGTTTAARIESASLQLLGAPYLDAPLGEGASSRYDAGPLVRLDGFDCTTFVETVLAAAKSKNVAEFEKTLQRIRYRNGQVGFATRNHFPCVDWIPQNSRNGILTDITEATGAAWGVEYATAEISKKGWAEKLGVGVIRVPGLSDAERATRLAELQAKLQALPAEQPHLPYIPFTKFITRKEVPADELARRAEEERQLAKSEKYQPRQPLSLEADLEKQLHDDVVGLKLKYLIQDTEVDAKLLAAIPSGTILNVVRPRWKIPGTFLNISHQGFVIQKEQGTFFRHVSKSTGRAKDVPLANYLRLCLLMPAIKGINLVQAR